MNILWKRLTAFLIFIFCALLVLGLMPSASRATGHEFDTLASTVSYLPIILNPAQPTATPTPLPSDFASQVIALTNVERQQDGCGDVTNNTQLANAAYGHSQDMGLNDFFSHTGSNDSSPWDRIQAQGYNYSTAGENIAAGYSSPEAVVAGWMNSPGHRANILNCSFVHIGVGYYYLANDQGNVNYYHYWTQVFAAP